MRILFLFALLFRIGMLSACDFCGCSPASSNWDQDAVQPSSYLQHSLFIKNVDFNDPDNTLNNSLIIGQLLIGAYSPIKKLELRATLPVLSMYNYFSENATQKEWGLGDALLQVNYLLVDIKPFEDKKLSHSLIATGGIELPTGSYAVSEDPLLSNIAFGSKSVDYSTGFLYKLTKFKGAFSAGTTAKLNTANRNDIRYGHQFNVFMQGAYLLSDKVVKWRATLGTRYDYSSRNIFRGIYQNKTGGNLWQMTAGINGAKKRWAWGVVYQQPILQNNGNGAFVHRPTIFTSLNFQLKK